MVQVHLQATPILMIVEWSMSCYNMDFPTESYSITLKQSWVYSGVALIPFQVYSRSGVDPDCSSPWSRIYAARLIPFHWSRGVSFYSGLLQCLNFSRQKVSDFFHP